LERRLEFKVRPEKLIATFSFFTFLKIGLSPEQQEQALALLECLCAWLLPTPWVFDYPDTLLSCLNVIFVILPHKMVLASTRMTGSLHIHVIFIRTISIQSSKRTLKSSHKPRKTNSFVRNGQRAGNQPS
jgi:hypothetical protein